MQITGAGSLELGDEGLHVKGFKVASSGRATLLVLGVVGAAAAVVGFRHFLGLDDSVSYGAGGAIGIGFLLPAMRKPARAGEPVEHLLPWSALSKVYYDGSSECLIALFKRSTPKGGLYIVQSPDSQLEELLKARLKKK